MKFNGNLCVLAIFQKQRLLVCQTPQTTEIDLDQPFQLVIWSLLPAEVLVLQSIEKSASMI